jgi:hypothetical protein
VSPANTTRGDAASRSNLALPLRTSIATKHGFLSRVGDEVKAAAVDPDGFFFRAPVRLIDIRRCFFEVERQADVSPRGSAF